MQLVNNFEVGRPLDETWPLLSDVERLVTYIPGAVLVSRDARRYHGHVAVRLGPIALKFEGEAEVTRLDEEAHTLSIRGVGRDRSGQGSVTALIGMHAAAAVDGKMTAVTVTTDLDLGGKVAQFGSGMIEKVASRIIKQFVARLEAHFAAESAGCGGPPTTSPVRDVGRPVVHAGSTSERVESTIGLLVAALGAFFAGLSLGRAIRRR